MQLVVPTKSGLPPDKHNFCHFLVQDPEMNGKDAYLKVKPDITTQSACVRANKLLKDPDVKAYLAVLLEERQKRLQIDEDWVINRLRDIHDRCMQAEPVYSQFSVPDEDGNMPEPKYYKFDAQGALKALELMGRHLRMFSDKVDSAALSVTIGLNLGGEKAAIEGRYERT